VLSDADPEIALCDTCRWNGPLMPICKALSFAASGSEFKALASAGRQRLQIRMPQLNLNCRLRLKMTDQNRGADIETCGVQ